MGLGDVSQSVAPKFGLIAPAKQGGSLCVRYFMPWSCHPSMAVTGAQCMTACLLTPGTVVKDTSYSDFTNPANLTLEHPSGTIDVLFEFADDANEFKPVSAGLVRTARKLAQGEVFVDSDIWVGK